MFYCYVGGAILSINMANKTIHRRITTEDCIKILYFYNKEIIWGF